MRPQPTDVYSASPKGDQPNDLRPSQFTPTQWDTAKDKAAFAKQFVRFVQSDFAAKHFTDRFYRRLSNTFGHIANYNRAGFWETFFTTTADMVRFLEQTLQHRVMAIRPGRIATWRGHCRHGFGRTGHWNGIGNGWPKRPKLPSGPSWPGCKRSMQADVYSVQDSFGSKPCRPTRSNNTNCTQ